MTSLDPLGTTSLPVVLGLTIETTITMTHVLWPRFQLRHRFPERKWVDLVRLAEVFWNHPISGITLAAILREGLQGSCCALFDTCLRSCNINLRPLRTPCSLRCGRVLYVLCRYGRFHHCRSPYVPKIDARSSNRSGL